MIKRFWLGAVLMGTAWAAPSDPWWNTGWPYRVEISATGTGVISANVNFTTLLNGFGLNEGRIDLRSLRVIPYVAGVPGNPIAYAESYSTLLDDAENPQINGGTGVSWSVNDGSAAPDTTRFSQGHGSVRATVQNLAGGYGYPGVEMHISGSDPRRNWQRYETFIYDVWPEVNASARDQAPDLYSFKLYDACDGGSVTQGGPPLALNRWNGASVSLRPLGSCWPSDGLNLTNITRMEFHTRDNDTVNGNSGLWDNGDVLNLWFDNVRLVDQDLGAMRWQSVPGASRYYVYFDVLTHEGHPFPIVNTALGPATITGTPGAGESGGYLHKVSGANLIAGLNAWSAPTTEKVLRTASVPTATAPLRVKAAKGEFEPFQLVVRSSTTRALAVSATGFTKPGGGIPAPRIHRVDYVNITTAGDHWDRFGLWPDPLWPLNQGENVQFSAGQNQPLWFTIQVPWNAAAGIYTGNVNIGGATIPVELEVWDFALPRTIHLESEWGFGWSQLVEMYRGTHNGNVESCYWQLVDALKQDFIDHRLIPKGVAWPAGLNYPGGVEYNCNGLLQPDAWGEWDFATIGGRSIHGQQGFNGGYGFPAFLALGPASNDTPDSFPFSFCGIDRNGVLGSSNYQAKYRQYLAAVDSYIVNAGYANAAYYHIVNEPQTDQHYGMVGQISAFIQSAAPHLRQLLSEQVEPAIYNHPGAKIDIWMPTISTYEPIKSQDRQKNHGESVWWYYLYGDDPPLPNPVLMSHPAMEARITPWLAWAERVDGLLHYSATDWSSNPWDTPNVTGLDNGDGYLFYPPRKDGQDLAQCGANGNRLVPSIRWENLRDGMEDYEYLYALNQAKPQIGVSNEADSYVARIVQSRTAFSKVPSDLEAARTALATRIAPKPVPDSRLWMMLACIALFTVAIETRRRRLSQG